MKSRSKLKKSKTIITLAIIFVSFSAAAFLYIYFSHGSGITKTVYTASDFGIETVKSSIDFNNNGLDDYTDILLGARLDAENHPTYDGRYYEGGYPPDNIGVCTDVIWRAFKNAGYSLRDMVDNDISSRPFAYPDIDTPDSNIDFRRVDNLRIFFDANAASLTIDTSDISQWQPGDIVVFGDDDHIGIVSDKRDKYGVPYLIHNTGQPKREEDALINSNITHHYRFDASNFDNDELIPWHE